MLLFLILRIRNLEGFSHTCRTLFRRSHIDNTRMDWSNGGPPTVDDLGAVQGGRDAYRVKLDALAGIVASRGLVKDVTGL